MPVNLFILLCFCLGVLANHSGQAEEAHPKIGVALSGGGARGLAHLGVLEALEELQVPIDYLAGTSMGGIIGGLYASGLSLKELRKAVLTEIDWDKVFNSKAYREQLTFREKRNQRRFFQIEIGLGKNGLTAPAGFIGGQSLLMELKRLTRNISIDDFSKLPIPFKAVATDLRTAEPYVLEKGDLALALRASMAVPFAFAPVEIDGHLLADGNILNNLPVDVVRAMGAEVVIAVNISTPLSDIDTSSSFFTVTKQAITAALIQNTRRALQQADLIITPALDQYNTTDFKKAAELIEEGYRTVMKMAFLFQGLRNSPKQYQRYRTTLQARIPTAQGMVTPTFIKLVGQQRTHAQILYHKVANLLNRPVNMEDIHLASDRLMSFNEIEQVTYHLQQDRHGNSGIVFKVQEKSSGPNYFRFGLNMSTNFKDKISFNVLSRHERLNINRLGAEWINELQVGVGYLFHTEFYQPLDYHQRYFIMPFAELERHFFDLYDDPQDNNAEYQGDTFRIGLQTGINFTNLAMLKIGLSHEDMSSYLQIGDPHVFSASFKEHQASVNLEYGFDSLDDRIFATHGTVLNFNTSFYSKPLGAATTYQKVELYLRHHYPLHQTMTFISEFTLSSVLDSKFDKGLFSIGGPYGLSGYAENDIKGNDVLLLRLGCLVNLSTLVSQEVGNVRFLGLLHAGNAWQNSFEELQMKTLKDLYYGGLGALVWDTRFGTIQTGTGYTTGGSTRYFLSLGNFLRN